MLLNPLCFVSFAMKIIIMILCVHAIPIIISLTHFSDDMHCCSYCVVAEAKEPRYKIIVNIHICMCCSAYNLSIAPFISFSLLPLHRNCALKTFSALILHEVVKSYVVVKEKMNRFTLWEFFGFKKG
jgi:hypothetical protein